MFFMREGLRQKSATKGTKSTKTYVPFVPLVANPLSQLRKPNVNSELPTMMLTYCLPFTE